MNQWTMMRPTMLLGISLLSAPIHAQWSSDPAAPMVLCNAPGEQFRVEVAPDGTGGWFCFWADRRNVDAALYGQHLDAEGHALWTPNGKLIASETGRDVDRCAPVLLDDGSVILSYTVTNSTNGTAVIEAVRLDGEGNEVWSSPLVVASWGPSPLGEVRIFDQLCGIRSGPDAVFAWMYLTTSLDRSFAYERISPDGTAQFGSPGRGVPNSGHERLMMLDDGMGGVLFNWNAPGTLSPVWAMRMDAQGAPAWSNHVDLSAGSTGTFLYGYETIAAGPNTYFTAWATEDNDILLSRSNNSGTLTFPAPVVACQDPNDQTVPRLLYHDNSLFVSWSDERPPAQERDQYVQKFTLDGAAQWAPDGIPLIQLMSTSNRVGIHPGDNGSILGTFVSTVEGYCTMRMLADGTLDWPTPVPFCTTQFEPVPWFHRELPDGDGGLVAFWQTAAGDLYAARIRSTGELGVGINDRQRGGPIVVYPNPATDQVTVRLNALIGTKVDIALGDLTGRTVYRSTLTSGGTELRLTLPEHLAPGRYDLILAGELGRYHAPLVLE